MERHLLMDITAGSTLYQLFYMFAFLAAYTVMIYEGYRRRLPMLAWVLILASIRLAVVAGTKVFSYSSADWQYMFANHVFLQNTQKTMFGGVLLGAGAYLLARYLLKFRHSVWDTVAVAFPVAVSIQTIGCFFYGCCYGTTSDIPWSVQYPVMSLAHYHQFESGLLTHNDLYSLPVHPVQLYQALGGILTVLIVLKFRKRWKAEGSTLLSSLIIFALFRFLAEFFRDPMSNKTGGEMLWIMKQVQWQYLGFAFLMTLLLLWREKTYKTGRTLPESYVPRLSTQILFLMSLVIIFLLLHKWFTLPEVIALNIALLPAVFLVGRELYLAYAPLRIKWVYALAAILPLFLMSQTLPQTQIDSTLTKTYKTYHTAGGGFSTGNYTTERTTYSGSGCDRVSDVHYFKQQYTTGGLGYSFTRMTTGSEEILTYGATIGTGRFTETNFQTDVETSWLLVDAGGYIKYDTKWIGLGAGLHLGNLVYSKGDVSRNGLSMLDLNHAYFKTPIFPSGYLRVGRPRYFFADVHIADQFPVSAPGLAFLAGIGTGFGFINGPTLRLGSSLTDESTMYVSAYIPIHNKFVIEPIYLWTNKNAVYPSYPNNLPENQFSLGLSYRFGHK
jgi:phosphatidylglycerol:prolipoprotein diacylglycerol transferase